MIQVRSLWVAPVEAPIEGSAVVSDIIEPITNANAPHRTLTPRTGEADALRRTVRACLWATLVADCLARGCRDIRPDQVVYDATRVCEGRTSGREGLVIRRLREVGGCVGY